MLDLPELPDGWFVAVDTETNALWADDGARQSITSIGWVDPEVIFDPDPERLRHAVKTGEGVHTLAAPFSQGPWVGPGDNPKPGVDMTLFDDPANNPNLGVPEYDQLMSFLQQHRLVFHNAKFDTEKLRYLPIGWRESIERCHVHAKLVLWKENGPADAATWTPSVTRMVSASNASMKTTEPDDPSSASANGSADDNGSSNTTGASARAAVKRGLRSSSSTTSTAMVPLTGWLSEQGSSATAQGTPPTGGLKLMGIQPGSKCYVRTATELKSVLKGVRPDIDCTCVLEGMLPDLEKLRYAPIGWGGEGVELLGNTVWDTQVCCPVIWPFARTSSLKPTAARLWGEDETAEAEALKPYLGAKSNPRFDLVPWEVIGPYAAKDAELTIRLFYHQMAVLGRWGDWGSRERKVYTQCLREVEVMKVLYRMERAGVPYDADASRAAGIKLEAEVARIDEMLPFRPTTRAAARWFFMGGEGAGLRPYMITERGAPRLTAQVVDRIIEDHGDSDIGRVASLWKRRAKLNHAASSWYTPWAEMVAPDGRLRTCFRQVTRGRGTEEGGTASGRFSVERVNLQAIPHDYRLEVEGGWPVESPRALIGRAAARLDGWEAWEFDLAQAELRVAAAWAGCTPMLDAIVDGRDLHGETATALFNREPGDPEWGFYRTLGKRGNFTLCFGAGGDTFGDMVAKETGRYLSRGEAKTIVEDWNALYPQFRRAIEYWDEYAQDRGFVPLASDDGFASGRVRVFKPGEDTHKAFNQIVQASLAEFMKVWLVEVQREMDRMGFGFVPGVGWTGLVLTIHDSLVGLFPEGERGEEAAARVTGVAARVWRRFFGRPDPLGRVAAVPGFAEGQRWSA